MQYKYSRFLLLAAALVLPQPESNEQRDNIGGLPQTKDLSNELA